jgi:hypothetical protein
MKFNEKFGWKEIFLLIVFVGGTIAYFAENDKSSSAKKQKLIIKTPSQLVSNIFEGKAKCSLSDKYNDKAEVIGKHLSIDWLYDEELYFNMLIRACIMDSTKKLLTKLQSSKFSNIESVCIIVRRTIIDRYGKSSIYVVATVKVNKEDWMRVNWNNIDSTKTYDALDGSKNVTFRRWIK